MRSTTACYAKTAGRVAIKEWYLTVPMGLHPGFTVRAFPPATANSTALTRNVGA